MNIVFFINKSHNFPSKMIEYMTQRFPEIKKEFYVVDRKNEVYLPNLNNVHRITSYFEFITNNQLRRNIRKSDKIIVSGVFTMQYVMMFMGKDILNKTYWQFWGGDYEVFNNEKITIKQKMRKKIVDRCLSLAKGIVLLTHQEVDVFKKVFGKVYDCKMFAVPVPSGSGYEKILKKVRSQNPQMKRGGKKRIIIGNSATVTNRHEKLFNKIANLNFKDIDLLCPLSYGNDLYRNEIVILGKRFFGDRFIPIVDYMEYDEYVSLLNSCDVGVYNHSRQQALGNISLMLHLGKKVYAPSNICDYYEQYGYKIYNIDLISKQNINEVLEFSDEYAKRNVKCLAVRQKYIYDEWKKIITD